jgi:hypothetical protein
MKLFVQDTSKGLIEIREGDDNKKSVQFIHQSVPDFLLRNGRLKRLDHTLDEDIIDISHDRLTACSMACITVKELQHYLEDWSKLKRAASLYPLLEYAVQNVLYHANRAKAGSPSQSGLLEWLRHGKNFAALTVMHDTISKGGEKYEGGTQLYALAVDNCVTLLRTCLLDPFYDVNAKGESYGNALQAARR